MSDLITVFAPMDAAELAIAKGILDGAGIRYITQGEGVQDLIGLGRLPSGYNVATGPVKIRVTQEDAARARELLADLRE